MIFFGYCLVFQIQKVMGRGKLNLELIANEKSRKSTFQKRKKGIMKKAYEFSVLCDIDVCLFISGPKKDQVLPQARSDKDDDRIETYPPGNDNVLRIIHKYQKTVIQRPPNKTYNLSGLLAERNKKVHADISRCRKKCYSFKYPTSVELVDRFSIDELAELVGRLDGKIEIVKKIIVEKKKNHLKMIRSYHQELTCLNNSTMDHKTPPPLQIASNFSVINSNSMMKLLSGDDNQSTNTSCFNDHDHQHHHQSKKYYLNGKASNSNDVTTIRGSLVYDDPMARVFLDNIMMFDSTRNGTITAPINNNTIMSNNNTMQYSTVTTMIGRIGCLWRNT